MLNPHQYATLILEPAYKACGMYSLDAMYQMMCSIGVESHFTHLKQLPTGPAIGLPQTEPDTYIDTIRYLNRRTDLRDKIFTYCQRTSFPDDRMLISDLAFSALIARVKYWMIKEPIPSYKDPQAQAAYYEKYYNVNKFVDKTQEFIRLAAEVKGWITHDDTTQS